MFSPKVSNLNMFNLNPGPSKIVNVLDPDFDMTDGLTLRQSSLRDRRGSHIHPNTQKLDQVVLTSDQ